MAIGASEFVFNPPLSIGEIVSRPNRFVMFVNIRGRVVRCHCPNTGRLGELDLGGVPCLLSKGKGKTRKTSYTVEAISVKFRGRRRSWVGINQNAANRYVENLLRTGQLPGVAVGEVKREVKLGKSRIDFLVGDTYVEVKTPLISLPAAEGVSVVRRGRFDSFERLIRHMTELSRSLKNGKKAVILMCYLYDAERFRPPAMDRDNARILRVAKETEKRGVQTWQVNLRIGRNGVKLIRYYRNVMFGRTKESALS